MSYPLHTFSKYFNELGIFNNLKNINELINRIKNLSSHNNRTIDQTKGDVFEVFAEALLNTNLKYNVKKAYPQGKVPKDILFKLNLVETDKGYDGVYICNENKINTYQVKFRKPDGNLTWRELSTFLAISENVKERMLITTTNKIDKEFISKRNIHLLSYSSLSSLKERDFIKVKEWLSQTTILKKAIKKDEFQKTAIKKILNELEKNNRTTCLMACGTGKTLVGMWVFEKLYPKITLILVPSIALIKQIRDDWYSDSNIKFDSIAVSSSKDTDKNIDEFVIEQDFLDFKMTTDAKKIRKFLNKNTKNPKVIFSTYQSSKKIGEALNGKKLIDFAIFDEAHRTSRVKKLDKNTQPSFSYALEDKNIFINKRLFMTATRRVSKFKDFNKEGDEKMMMTMDNNKIFGNVCYDLTFNQGAKLGIIAKPKVIISYITSREVEKEIRSKSITIIKDKEINTDQVAHQIAIKKAVEKYLIKKVFTFHTSVRRAKSFTRNTEEGIKSFLPKYYSECIVGSMKHFDRENIMRNFKQKEFGILSNARCLVEGVNVPSVGMVAFVNPKQSEIDIIQAIGRALRKRNDPSKKFGYVLIPIFVETKKNETEQDALKRTRYEKIAIIIKALREHDDEINSIINEVLVSEKRGKGFSDKSLKKMEERIFGIHPHLSKEILIREIKSKIIDDLRTSWDDKVSMLLAFKDKFGHCKVPKKYSDNQKLSDWVNDVRNRRRNGTLFNFQIKQLDNYGFEWSFEGETLKSIEGLKNEKYIMKNILHAVSTYRKAGLIEPEGRYFKHSLGHYYNPEKVKKFKAKLNITYSNISEVPKDLFTESALIKAIQKKYKINHGNKKIKKACQNGKIKSEGTVVLAAGVTNLYKIPNIDEIKNVLGLDIISDELKGYISLTILQKKFNLGEKVKKAIKKGLIIPKKGPNISREFSWYIKKIEAEKIKSKHKKIVDYKNVNVSGSDVEMSGYQIKGYLTGKDVAFKLGYKSRLPIYDAVNDKKIKADLFLKIAGAKVAYFKNDDNKLDIIRKALGITLKTVKNLYDMNEFSKKTSHSKTNLRRKIENGDIVPKGVYPAGNGRLTYFFDENDVKKHKR